MNCSLQRLLQALFRSPPVAGIRRRIPVPHRVALLALLAFTGTAAVQAAEEGDVLAKPRETYQTKLVLIQDKYLGNGFDALSNRYCTLLSGQADAARARGDLRSHLAAQQELERFRTSGAVTEEDLVPDGGAVADAQRSFMATYAAHLDRMHREEAQLTAAYLRFLGNTMRTLTRENRIDDAIRVEAEIESVQSAADPGLPTPAAPATASTPAPPPPPPPPPPPARRQTAPAPREPADPGRPDRCHSFR